MKLFNLFKQNCVFCDSKLPDEIKGKGEHVIPESLLSNWHVHFVCSNCMQYFGDNVDELAFETPSIISAMEQLGIEKANDYWKKIPFKAEDITTNENVSMLFRDGNFIPKVESKENDRIVNHPPSPLKHVALDFQKKRLSKEVSDLKIKNELSRIELTQKTQKTNELVYSDLLKSFFRKGTVKTPEVDKDRLKKIEPLIAKIVICFVNIFFSETELKLFKNYNELKKYAIGKSEIKKLTIHRTDSSSDKPEFSHFVHGAFRDQVGLMIRVSFWTYCDYQCYLFTDHDYKDFFEGKDIKYFFIEIDNEIPKEPSWELGFKGSTEEQYHMVKEQDFFEEYQRIFGKERKKTD